MLRRVPLVLALALFPAIAAAQVPGGGLYSVGPITPNDCAKWVSAFALTDSGGTCSGGGSGSPGGASGTMQYNNGGNFGGVTGATTNGTSLTVSSGNLKLSGASSGTAIVNAPATGGGTLTLPAGTDTVAGIAATQTFTGKSISGSTNTLSNIGSASLSNTAVTAGTYGDATHCPYFTVNAEGQLTAASNNTSCPGGGGGGSLTVTDGTNSVANTTTLTVGNGLVVGGSAGSATLNPTTPDVTKSANYTVAASDMGGIINLSSTGTLTIPAISGTVFASGMTSCFSVIGTGNWTVSSTPTLNGFSGTTLVPGSAGCFVSNGTSLDFQPGQQTPTTTRLGGVLALGATSHQFLTSISTAGAPVAAQPAVGDISGFGTGVATALGTNVGSAGAPIVNGGALGTPSSGTLTSATGLPISTGVSGLGTGVATALGSAVSGSGSICLSSGSACSGGGGGGGLPTLGYRTGQWYGCFCSGPQTQVTLTANRIYYVPFLALESKTFTKIAIFVSSNVGTSCRLGVYTAGTGVPGSLVDDSGTVSTTTTGFKTITGRTIAVTANTWYYNSVLCDGAPSVQGIQGSGTSGQGLQDALLGASAPGFGADQNYGAQTFGALPSTFPTTTQNAGGSEPQVSLSF